MFSVFSLWSTQTFSLLNTSRFSLHMKLVAMTAMKLSESSSVCNWDPHLIFEKTLKIMHEMSYYDYDLHALSVLSRSSSSFSYVRLMHYYCNRATPNKLQYIKLQLTYEKLVMIDSLCRPEIWMSQRCFWWGMLMSMKPTPKETRHFTGASVVAQAHRSQGALLQNPAPLTAKL